MSNTTKVLIVILIPVLAMLIWAIYFANDFGVIDDFEVNQELLEERVLEKFYDESKMKGKM